MERRKTGAEESGGGLRGRRAPQFFADDSFTCGPPSAVGWGDAGTPTSPGVALGFVPHPNLRPSKK